MLERKEVTSANSTASLTTEYWVHSFKSKHHGKCPRRTGEKIAPNQLGFLVFFSPVTLKMPTKTEKKDLTAK